MRRPLGGLRPDVPLTATLEGEPGMRVLVPANETKTQKLYLVAPAGSAGATSERSNLRIWIEDEGTELTPGTDRVHHDTVFNGKAK